MSCLVDFNRNLQSPAGLLYLPPIVCFPIHLRFPLYGPLTSKKKPVCYWLQFCSHLFQRFCVPLCLNSLPFMPLFLMLLLFLEHPTHRYQIGNCTLFHSLTLQSMQTQNSLLGIPLMETEEKSTITFPHRWLTVNHNKRQSDFDFIPIQAKE